MMETPEQGEQGMIEERIRQNGRWAYIAGYYEGYLLRCEQSSMTVLEILDVAKASYDALPLPIQMEIWDDAL